MDRDDFIISGYCLVEVQDAAITIGRTLRKRGLPPKLSDPEMITAPLPVCEYVRSRRNQCFKPDAD